MEFVNIIKNRVPFRLNSKEDTGVARNDQDLSLSLNDAKIALIGSIVRQSGD